MGGSVKRKPTKNAKRNQNARFFLPLLRLLLLMLIPNGGLGKVFSLLRVRVSQVFYILFFFFVVVFPLHKKCAVQFVPLLSGEGMVGGKCFCFAAGEDDARQRLLE